MLTDIAEVTSASPIEEGAGEQGTQPTSDRRNRKGSGLDSMVLAELKQVANSLGIKGTGALRKSQLIDAIRAAQRGAGTATSTVGTDQDNGYREEARMGEPPAQPDLMSASRATDSAAAERPGCGW